MAAQSSTTKLYAALIILAGIAGGYLLYSQWVAPGEEAIPPSPISSHDDLAAFKSLTIDFSVFTSPAYKNLVIFGELPVNPGITGKKDLFAP